MEEELDIAIIGAGGAGLTAAIYAVRSGMDAMIFEGKIAGGMANTAWQIENFPTRKKIAGVELMNTMKEHALEYIAVKEGERVEEVKEENEGFVLKTSEDEYTARSLLLATGAEHRRLGVPGEAQYRAGGVSYCATCDGYFFKGKKVLMVGGGSCAANDALFLGNIGIDVTVVHRRDSMRAEQVVMDKLKGQDTRFLWNSEVKEIKGDGGKVTSVALVNNKTGEESEIEADGVFIDVGYDPNNELAKALDLELYGGGYIKVGRDMRTSKRMVYAAGDITGGLKQLIVACGEGAVAATSAYEDVTRPYWAKK